MSISENFYSQGLPETSFSDLSTGQEEVTSSRRAISSSLKSALLIGACTGGLALLSPSEAQAQEKSKDLQFNGARITTINTFQFVDNVPLIDQPLSVSLRGWGDTWREEFNLTGALGTFFVNQPNVTFGFSAGGSSAKKGLLNFTPTVAVGKDAFSAFLGGDLTIRALQGNPIVEGTLRLKTQVSPLDPDNWFQFRVGAHGQSNFSNTTNILSGGPFIGVTFQSGDCSRGNDSKSKVLSISPTFGIDFLGKIDRNAGEPVIQGFINTGLRLTYGRKQCGSALEPGNY